MAGLFRLVVRVSWLFEVIEDSPEERRRFVSTFRAELTTCFRGFDHSG